MAVQRIGSVAVAATSATMPAHQAGDLLICYAFNNASVSFPTLVSGWTNWLSLAGTTCAMRVGFRYARSSSEVSGTWTSATSILIEVWRDAQVGAVALGSGSSTTITYPALTLVRTDSASWVTRAAGHRTATNMTTNTPTGYTARDGVSTAIRDCDTNGTVAANPTTGTQAVSASSGWIAVTGEILPKTVGGPWSLGINASPTSTSTQSPLVSFSNYAPLADDVVVAWFRRAAAGQTITVPSGWVNVLGGTTDVENSTQQMCCFYHVVTSAEATAATTSWTLTNLYATAVVTRSAGAIIRGADTTNPVDAFGSTFNSSSVTPSVFAGLLGADVSTDSVVVSAVGSGSTYTTSSAAVGEYVMNSNSDDNFPAAVRAAPTVTGVAVATTNITPAAASPYISITAAFSTPAAAAANTGQFFVMF